MTSVMAHTQTSEHEWYVPFTMGLRGAFLGMIYAKPSHGLDFVPPLFVFFITSHDDVLNMNTFALQQLLLNLRNSDSKDRQWSETILGV